MENETPNEAGWFDHDRPLVAVLNLAIRARVKLHGADKVRDELKDLLGRIATLAADKTADNLIQNALNEDKEH